MNLQSPASISQGWSYSCGQSYPDQQLSLKFHLGFQLFESNLFIFLTFSSSVYEPVLFTKSGTLHPLSYGFIYKCICVLKGPLRQGLLCKPVWSLIHSSPLILPSPGLKLEVCIPIPSRVVILKPWYHCDPTSVTAHGFVRCC